MSRFTLPKRILKNTRGFTLVELLIVVLILGLMGTMAISNYISTAGTFGFIAKQKELNNAIRNARTLAVTDKDMGEMCGDGDGAVAVTAERYGVHIEARQIKVFADVSPSNSFSLGQCDIEIKNISLGDDYELSVLQGADTSPLTLPVTLLYERGSGDFSARQSGGGGNANVIVSKEQYKYISIAFKNTKNNQENFILIFQVSGLPEFMNNLDAVN